MDDLYWWDEVLAVYGLHIPVALVCTSLVAVGFALVAPARLQTSRARALAIAPAILLTLQSAGLIALMVVHSGYAAIGWATAGPPMMSCFPQLPPDLCQERMLILGAVLLTFAVPGVFLALARVCRPKRLLGALAAVVGTCGLTVSAFMDAPELGRVYFWTSLRPEDFEALASRPTLEIGGLAVVAVGLLSTALVLRTRRPAMRSLMGPALAFAVFLIGVAAVWATRPHAYDRTHPVRLRHGQYTRMQAAGAASCPSWLRADRVDELSDAPVVALFESARVDGRPVDERNTLQERLEQIRREASRDHFRTSFTGEVVVLASPDLAVSRLVPVLKSIAAAGYLFVHFRFASTERVQVGLLGPIDLPVLVEVRFYLEPYGPGSFEHPEFELTCATLECLLREFQSGRRESLPVPAPDGYVE